MVDSRNQTIELKLTVYNAQPHFGAVDRGMRISNIGPIH